jgi:hypothetical protein
LYYRIVKAFLAEKLDTKDYPPDYPKKEEINSNHFRETKTLEKRTKGTFNVQH